MKRPATLQPVFPSAGLNAAYRKHLLQLLQRMQQSYEHWIGQAYPPNLPNLPKSPKLQNLASDANDASEASEANDASAFDELSRTLTALGRYWLRRFAQLASPLARYVAGTAERRSRKQLRKLLKAHGWTVEFEPTPAMQSIIDQSIKANVSLIRSIPREYHREIRKAVHDSVTAGRDLQTLSKALSRHYAVTRQRAALIARDQNNKAFAAMQRARQLEVNIKQAVWYHSHAGRQPRPTHVKNHLKVYDVAKGWYDPAVKKRIWPGTEINCRCWSRPIVPGLK